MARIVLGNREGLLAIRHGRSVLEFLTDEWPDLQLRLRTVPKGGGQEGGPLLHALASGEVGIAVAQLERLPPTLPDGIKLAAVLRRGEPRSALAAKGKGDLGALPAAARIAVTSERDGTFLAGINPGFQIEVDASAPDVLLARVGAGIDAAILPAATLITLDLRSAIDVVLDETVFAPAPGQGAVGLLVRDDDDLAFETAYSLQHRPSFDRVRAELAFAAELPDMHVGSVAWVTEDGELTLFGSVARGGTVLQAYVTGEAREGAELGRELAKDVREQLARA